MNTSAFTGLSAFFLNCSIKPDKTDSHTQLMLDRAAGIMEAEGVDVTKCYALDHHIAFGMVEDGSTDEQPDGWPEIQKQIMAADIFVLGTRFGSG